MMNFKRAAIAMVAAAAAVLFSTGPASAGPPRYSMTVVNGESGVVETVLYAATAPELQAKSAAQCNAANDVCVWQNTNFTGWFFHWSHGYIWGQANHCLHLAYNVSNQVSSAGNHSPYLVYLRDDGFCGGAGYTLYQGRNVNTTGYDNRASSIYASNIL